eukprot:3166252-Pyramimonas_sp.AAC.1
MAAACAAPNSAPIAIATFAGSGLPALTLAALHLQYIALPGRSTGALPSAAAPIIQNSVRHCSLAGSSSIWVFDKPNARPANTCTHGGPRRP